ncbi:MAG: CoA transferase [Aeromicrobium sp.]
MTVEVLGAAAEQSASVENLRMVSDGTCNLGFSLGDSELESRIRSESADHWFAKLSEHGVPCGPINNIQQAFELAERPGLAPDTKLDAPDRSAPVHQVSNPIQISLTPATYRAAPPLFLEPHDSRL